MGYGKRKPRAAAPKAAPEEGEPSLAQFMTDQEAYNRSVEAFKRFDSNGDGVISRDELGRVFRALDPDRWTDARITKLMDAADKNGDGLIGYEEFVFWLMGGDRTWDADRGAACLKGSVVFQKEGLIAEHRETENSDELFMISIDQEIIGTGKLGLQVDASDGRTLRIKGITEDGAISDWNKESAQRVVQAGDRIIDINGIKDNAKLLMKELKKKVLLEIFVQPQDTSVKYIQKLDDIYDAQRTEIATGEFSVVRKAKQKDSDIWFAIKSVSKKKTPHDEIEEMLAIMKKIDHPNIIKVFDVIEDHLDCHLVTEFCEGGELLERVLADTHFSERNAVRVMKQILAAVAYLHSSFIVHRDIRPEHLLLVSSRATQNAVVKLIDFRAAREYDEGMKFQTKICPALYAAPEVLMERGYSGPRADMWSCGAIMYLTISGYPPFAGDSEYDTIREVTRAQLAFPDDWKLVTQECKDLVMGLLRKNPEERLTGPQALRHTWIENSEHLIDFPLHQGQQNMKAFVGANKLKKAALHAIAQRMSEEEIRDLQDMFALLDQNGDKMITFYELKAGLDRLGKEETLKDLQVLFEAIDVDGSRHIEYTEFMAAALHKRCQLEESVCRVAFQTFDADNSGFISKKELTKVLGQNAVQDLMSSQSVARVLEETDIDNDGKIDFHEFMSLMRAGAISLDSV